MRGLSGSGKTTYAKTLDAVRVSRDDVVKAEMYNRHIRGTYDLMAVFDDRQRVVDMWRARGINCWQTAPGDF